MTEQEYITLQALERVRMAERILHDVILPDPVEVQSGRYIVTVQGLAKLRTELEKHIGPLTESSEAF